VARQLPLNMSCNYHPSSTSRAPALLLSILFGG
jgi:hypothetical protein